MTPFKWPGTRRRKLANPFAGVAAFRKQLEACTRCAAQAPEAGRRFMGGATEPGKVSGSGITNGVFGLSPTVADCEPVGHRISVGYT